MHPYAPRLIRCLDLIEVADFRLKRYWIDLQGEPGPTRDCLVYGAALCLWHLGRHGSLREAADAVRAVLDGRIALT